MTNFRHEYKFILNYSEYILLHSRLKSLLKHDSNVGDDGEYRIRSLYFDNYYDMALKEKLNGINNREKFRIRYYNNNFDFLKLEKKSKIDGLSQKISCSITKEECEKILNNEVYWMINDERALIRELYLKMKMYLLRPKVIVDYIREPFIYEEGNVRITLDRDVRTGLYATDLFDLDIPMIPSGDRIYLVEVKYDEYLPEIVRKAVGLTTEMQVSYSKYASSRVYG